MAATAASASPQAVENQLKTYGFKRDVDALALYLAREVRSVPGQAWLHRLICGLTTIRCSETMMCIAESAASQPPLTNTWHQGEEMGRNDKLTNLKVLFENPEDATLLRAMTRSLMEFSSVDWNKVGTCQQRWFQNKAEETPREADGQI